MKQILPALGYEIEARPVVVGEDLSAYHRIILYLAPFTGFVAKHALGALWTQHAGGGKVIHSFDDWQIPPIYSSALSLLARWDKVVGGNMFGYSSSDKAERYKNELKAACESLVEGTTTNNILIPCYDGGDYSLLRVPGDPKRLKPYNPACLFQNYYGKSLVTAPKLQQWILAALHDHQSWLRRQHLRWPVLQFGSRKLEQERLTEEQIYDRYLSSAGVLSPAYNICGSGWWRARHGLAADAGCVLAGSPLELRMIGSSYLFEPSEAEAVPEEVTELAQLQAAEFYKAAGTKEELLERMKGYIES